MTDVEPTLSCRDLGVAIGDRTILRDVTLSVSPGEIYGLLGPNGAGKTTLINAICGLRKVTLGTIRVLGKQVGSERGASNGIGLVPQDIALYEQMSAGENLRFFGRLAGLKGQQLAASVTAALIEVGLQDRERDRVATFSGGMKRRTNIAVALLINPKLYVFDEPTVGVDPQSRNAILDNLRRLAEGGASVVFASHYMEEVHAVAHRVGILDHGSILAEGSPEGLIKEHGGSAAVDVQSDGVGEQLLKKLGGRLPGWTVVQTEVGVRLTTENGIADGLPKLLKVFSDAGINLSSLDVRPPTLEDVFLNLTGRGLRDG